MGLFDNFPYTNLHEINLDWILNKLGLLDSSVESAEASASSASDSKTEAAASAAKAEEMAANAEKSAENAQAILANGRRFLFIGDSYADGWNPETSSYITSWVDYIQEYLGLTDYTGYAYHAGGTGFVNIGQTGKTFQGLMEAAYQNIKSPETITDVIVLGGANDTTHRGQIANAITAFKIKCAELFPAATFRLGFVGRNVSPTKAATTADNYFLTFLQYIGQNTAYLAGMENCCRNIEYFFNDGIHPNSAGQVAIATQLYRALTGCATVKRSTTLIGVVAAPETGFEFTGNAQTSNDITTLYVARKQYTFAESLSGTFDGSVEVDMGQVTSGPLSTSIFNAEVSLPGHVILPSGVCPAVFNLYIDSSNHIKVKPIAANENGWITEITGIFFYETTKLLNTNWY